MRIVGGMFGGRRFTPPSSIPARPTTDLAKEGLFNMLANRMSFEGIKTCDLFAGTGNISYELASRGVENLTLVERDPVSISFIKKTAEILNIQSQLHIIRSDVFRFIKQNTEQYDLIFADPPYALENIDDLPILVFDNQMLAPGGIFVMEHGARNDYQRHPQFQRMKNYGTTTFTFFTQPSA